MKIEIDELEELARGQREIAALLAAPVIPEYDRDGKIVGAKRELPQGATRQARQPSGAPRSSDRNVFAAARPNDAEQAPFTKGAKRKMYAAMVDFVWVVRDWAKAGFAKRDERISALEARIAELEKRGGG